MNTMNTNTLLSRRHRRSIVLIATFASLLGANAALSPCAAAKAAPARGADSGTVRARTSAVAPGVSLPEGTERVESAAAVAKLFEPLQGDAANFGTGELGAREVIGWDYEANPGLSPAAAKKGFLEALRGGGYTYDEVGPVQTGNPAGPIQFFYARSPRAGKRILGYTISTKGSLLVVWSQLAGGPAPEVAKAPAALTGKTWRATKISGTTFWSGNGAYAGSGTQQAAMITFLPDGTYRLQVYNQSRSGDWGMQAYTWVDGKASFDGDLLVLHPTGGKYKGADTKMARNNFERPMTEKEIRENGKLYRWEMGSENGKPVLRLGSSRKDVLTFRPTTD